MATRDSRIQTQQAANIQDLADFVAVQTVSPDAHDMDAGIAFLTRFFQDRLHAQVTVVPTAGWPTLTARLTGTHPQTIAFYGHYDTQPADDRANWDSDPFKLTQRAGRLYGRGAGDNKGQLMAQLLGIATYLETHEALPFNLVFVIEGEEELGSRHLAETVTQLRTTILRDVELAVVIDGSLNASGEHVLRLGNRGILGLALTANTGDLDTHSGNTGNVAINAIQYLMQVVNRLYDAEQQRVLIPHFYDGVPQDTASYDRFIDQLPYNAAAIQREFHLARPLSRQEYYHRLMTQPTFNLVGFHGGYAGPGLKTIVPHTATVKLDCRLVGRQNIAQIEAGIRELLAPELANGRLALKVIGSVPPSSSTFNQRTLAGFQRILQAATGSGLIEPTMPGTVPNYVWTDILQVPTITIPYANADQQNHAPNENLTVQAYQDGIRLSYELVAQLQPLLAAGLT